MKTDVILKFEQNFKNLTEKMKNTVKTHNTGLVNNLFCIIAYIVIISLSLVSCKEPEESPPAAKDMILVDISRNTDWDYMIAAKDGSCAIYNVDEETKIPTLIYYKPDKNLDMGYTILLKENGLPDRMIINGTVYYLSNFDGYKFDLAIISPNGDIEIYKGNDSIETDTNWDEYDKIEEYIHRSAFTFEEGLDAVDLGLQIAGHAIGIGSCILAFIPPVNLLGAVGCGTYIASTAASISIDQMEKAGYLESVHADSLNLLLDVGGCAGRDPVACASALTGTISLLMGLDLDASDELSQEIAAAYYELENNPLIRVRSVIISDTPDILDVGDTHTLKATVTPSNATYKNVIWTSSNPAVATVNNNGTITANSAGTAIITARTIDGGYAATYVATVDGITLDKETLNLIVSGPPGLLNATVYSYKGTHSITWTSSNPAVATVGSGTSNAINLGKTVNNNAVMAVSAGTAVITATAVINSNIAQLTFTISCTVTVTGGGGNNNGGNNASWTSPTGIKMMQINAGTYTRGIANDSMYRASPPHQVTLTKSFYMGKYLVTQDQYMEVMGYDPSQNTVGTPLPVDSVSWYDAVEFCNKLSLKENRTPVYTITGRTPASGYPIDSAAVTVNWNANGYRLPTEAEWEYACRAGTTTLYNTGDEITPEQANFSYSFLFRSTPVDRYEPNAWGLHDMHGNVDEWCWDRYGDYTSEAKTDPLGPVSGAYRVIRGGYFSDMYSDIRSASRKSQYPDYPQSGQGFRIVCLSSAVTPDDPDECNENCLEIGDTGPGGGIIIYHYHPGITITGYGNAGDPGYFPSYTARYLEADPNILGVLAWASPAHVSTTIEVSDGLGRGRSNTAAILAVDANAPAALACRNHTGGGKNDWFFPSSDEAYYFTRAKIFLGLTPGMHFLTSSVTGRYADFISISEDEYASGSGNIQKNNSTKYVIAVRAF